MMIKTRNVNNLVYNYKATVLKVVEGNLIDVNVTKGLRINVTNLRVKLADVEIPKFNGSLPARVVKMKRERAKHILNYLVGGRRVLMTTYRPSKSQMILCNLYVPCMRRCMEEPRITEVPHLSEPYINVRNTMILAGEKDYDFNYIAKLVEPLEPFIIS